MPFAISAPIRDESQDILPLISKSACGELFGSRVYRLNPENDIRVGGVKDSKSGLCP